MGKIYEQSCIRLSDLEIEKLLLNNESLDDLLYFRDLRQRRLYLDGDIESFTVSGIVQHIMRFNREDKELEDVGSPCERKPIILYITSNGGDVGCGFELIDVIQNSKTPVYTVNLGYQYSMGFLIGLAGHKRFATRNAKFLMHDGSDFVYNSGAKVQDQMEFKKHVDAKIREYVLSKSKVTGEEYDSKLRVEWYMFADEAKQRGFTDYIVGVDCDIDLIL